MAVPSEDYRHAISHFASGVSVVTTINRDEPRGMTASAVASVSLQPVQLLVCMDRESQTRAAVSASRIFAVNILASDQEELSRIFAAPHDPSSSEFAKVPYKPGDELGAPILDGVLAYLECRVNETYLGGDHDIFLGIVEAVGVPRPDAEPLIYFQSSYGRFAPLLGPGRQNGHPDSDGQQKRRAI